MVTVVGMGAQDDFGQAQGFVDRTGVASFPMIWDESFETWAYYGVRGQPTAILVDRNGNPIAGWSGFFDADEVVELARAEL